MPIESRPSGPPSRLPVTDWLRAAFLVVGFAALGWLLLTRYSGPGRFEPDRRRARDFFRAAQARDSVRLRALVNSNQPLRWALDARAQVPSLLPALDSGFYVRGVQRWGDTEEVSVWTGGPCSRRPIFVTFVGKGRNRRIQEVQTDCSREPAPDTTVKP